MNYFAIAVFLCIGACLGDSNTKANDNPIINGGTVPAPITEVDPPIPPSSTEKPTTTKAPTFSPNTSTTTTETPPTNSTTVITTTTPKTTTSTTKPTTTTPITPVTTSKTTTPTPITTPTTPNSTMAPVTTTTSPHHDRKFDGPSFVGGIILALGLVAIGFVAFKFYKARTELNYHTL